MRQGIYRERPDPPRGRAALPQMRQVNWYRQRRSQERWNRFDCVGYRPMTEIELLLVIVIGMLIDIDLKDDSMFGRDGKYRKYRWLVVVIVLLVVLLGAKLTLKLLNTIG